MKIENGRWVSSNGEMINHQNYSEFKKLKDSLSTMTDDITYDKITLMSFILTNKNSATKLSKIINNEEILKRL
jgi:hypothetical protein